MFGGPQSMGGGAGRGSMLRVAGRAVARANVSNLQEPISSSSASATSPTRTHRKPNPSFPAPTNNTHLILSSAIASPFSASTTPVSGASSSWPPHADPCCDDTEDWVYVDGVEHNKSLAFADDFALAPPPSTDEVHNAVSALSHVFDPPTYSQLIRDKFAYNLDRDLSDQVLSFGSELDWMEPSPYLHNPRMLYSYESQRVYDAFRLLQTEPAVQRMVVSLSSDKAVWDAVQNNPVVQELREKYYADEAVTQLTCENSDENRDESNPAMNFVRWIFDNTRAKVMELMETIGKLVNQLFKQPYDGKTREGTPDPFEERLRTSFMLSIVVLLIVVVTRAPRA